MHASSVFDFNHTTDDLPHILSKKQKGLQAMNPLSRACSAIALSVLFLVACSDKQAAKGHSEAEAPAVQQSSQAEEPDVEPQEVAPELPALLAEIDELEKLCPKLMTGLQVGQPGCVEMLQKWTQAGEMGWCWTGRSATDTDRSGQRWARCETVNSKVAEAVVPPPPPPPQSQSRGWFAHNINHSQCIEADSPASMIRTMQGDGQRVHTTDLHNGGVEVERNIGGGRSEVFTFYPSMGVCLSTLPRSQSIPGRYE